MKRTLMFLAILFPSLVLADMGAIAPNGPADLREPSQKALILHNGREEVLILGTDIRVEPVRPVIRFIPFPSEPTVFLAPENAFRDLNAIVKKKDLQMAMQTKGLPGTRTATEMLFNKRLGVHDITAVRLSGREEFREWLKKFLVKNGFPSEGLTVKTAAVAEDYIKRGFNYFVFDIVRPAPGTNSTDPVCYRFKSRQLYYPLKTSSLFRGNGVIQLAVCAPTARDLYGMIGRPYEVSTTAPVKPAELTNIYRDSRAFFRNIKKPPVLQVIRLEGELDYGEDILFDPLKGLKELGLKP